MNLKLLLEYRNDHLTPENSNENYIRIHFSRNTLYRKTFIHKGLEKKNFFIEITENDTIIKSKCSCDYKGLEVCKHVISSIDLVLTQHINNI